METLVDKLIDYWIIKYFTWTIKIFPRKIHFKDANWTTKQILVIQNKSNSHLLSVYILWMIKNWLVKDVETESPKSNSKEFENEIWWIIWDHSILRLNGKDKEWNEAFIIKISSISSWWELKFILKSRNDLSIRLKVLSYTNTPEQTLEQPDSFAVPIKLPIPFNMANMGILLRKGNPSQ